jgi:hypothetical protein
MYTGVVGCTPILQPGECFQYYSATDLSTPSGMGILHAVPLHFSLGTCCLHVHDCAADANDAAVSLAVASRKDIACVKLLGKETLAESKTFLSYSAIALPYIPTQAYPKCLSWHLLTRAKGQLLAPASQHMLSTF